MSTICVNVYPKSVGSDPWTVAREAIELSQRLGIDVMLRVTPSYSIEVDGDADAVKLQSSIFHGRAAHAHTGQK